MTLPDTKVVVVGLGYVGLPTAAVLAGRGMEVVGVDTNSAVVRTVNDASVHIAEPELDVLVRAAFTAGRLRAVPAPEPADVFLIAVPTPLTPQRSADLTHLEAAVRAIAPMLRKGNLVILESTCPVGTTENMSRALAAARPDLRFPHEDSQAPDVHIAYCPERVLPGRVLRELVQNDRVVGGLSLGCGRRAAAFYGTFVQGECLVTHARTAEMVKLAENAFRDVSIAFANELALLCETLGIDVWEVIELANRHPRVNILRPGPGVGGHCIAVDPWFIISAVPERARVLRIAREVNDSRPQIVVAQVKRVAAAFASPTIACLGLTYKADVDDLRESPAVAVVQQLAAEQVGALIVVEPYIGRLPLLLAAHSNIRLASLDEALEVADVVVGLVDHRVFKGIDRRRLNGKIVIDTRGMWR